MLKTKKVSGFANYDESKFFAQSELPKINEPEYQKYLKDGMHDLSKIVAADQFKSTEELTKLFNERVGKGKPVSSATDDFDKQMAAFESKPVSAVAAAGGAGIEDDLPWDAGSATNSGDVNIDDDLDSLLAGL